MNKRGMLPIIVVIVLALLIIGVVVLIPWKTGNTIWGGNIYDDVF